MNSATFVHKPENRVALGEAVRMVLIKNTKLTEESLPTLLVPSRRGFFYNRRPNCVTSLGRRGAKEDVDVEFNVSGLFSSYENDAALVGGRKGEVALLEVKVGADGMTSVAKTLAPAPLAAEIVAASFLNATSETVALLANGAVVTISADLKTVTELRKETPIKNTFINAYEDFVLVPLNDGIDVISLATKKSALNNSWVPHAHSEPIIAVHIFRRWKPTNGGANIVMTVGAGGREVRLWTGLGNASLELAAHLTLDLPKDEEKRVSVADKEENVLISFGNTVIVLSTDENKIRFARATEWEQSNAASAFCCYYEVTKSGEFQLNMVSRTPEAVTSTKFPPSIFGEANLTSAAGAAAPATATHEREANYFANARAKDTSAAVVVSSSLSPAVVDNGVAEKAAAAAIAAVSADASRKITGLKTVVNATNKEVSTLVGSLQTQSTQATAAKLGKEHAARNASRFTNAVGAAAPAAAATPAAAAAATAKAAGQNVEQLNLICNFISGAVTNAVTSRADGVVIPKVKATVEQIGGDADVADVALPKLTSVPQMQNFNASIDKALKVQNDFLKAEADTRASTYNAQVVRSGTTTRQSIAESKKFLADLKAELAGLTKDVEAVKVELATSSDRSAIGAVSSANVVEDAIALVEKRDFESAIQKITQAKNFQLLLEFIGHPIVKAASDSSAFVPGSISAPAFGMLVQQLAADIDTSKGHIAPRVAWLFTLAMDWDDHIDETFEGSDEKAKQILNTLAPSMAVARRNIEGLAAVKDDVSIESRRQARTIARILAKFEQ